MGKVEDALLGLAIGDALGVPVEFTTRDSLFKNPVTDMRGYGSHNVPAGTWSDDTSMTIATMDAIINYNGIDYYEIMNSFVKWFNDRDYTATGRVFDIGRTCASSILNYARDNIEPTKAGQKSEFSNGNGSLMRIMPISFYADSQHLSDVDICRVVSDVSSLTHAHSISKMGCYIYVQYLIRLIHGASKVDAYKDIQQLQYSEYFDSGTIKVYDRVLKNDIGTCDQDVIESSGYVVDSLEAALWCVLNNTSFRDTVLQAVNLGEDTDTVGAIAGAVAGIIYGKGSIPEIWIHALARNEYLSEIADEFTRSIYI